MSVAAVRTLISIALISTWLTLLMVGWILNGAVHSLLIVSLVIFPWKSLR